MSKIAFLDRDGTIILEPKDTKQINGLEQMEFLPGVISSLKRLQDAGYKLIVISNQDGLGTNANPIENYELINNKIEQILASEGVKIDKWLTCPHFEWEDCTCRKPKTGLIDLEVSASSVMIGDRQTDIQFAKNLNIPGYLISKSLSWNEITNSILSRRATINRKTKETDVNIVLNIDGSGKSSISTGLKFLDHMLEQISRHGSFDLELSCRGDLEIDEHHTIEDIAICLGGAYKAALGNKNGISRFASLKIADIDTTLPATHQRIVPLDEAISFVSIDVSGRPFCNFDAKFEREYCGDLPTEMIPHFFQSFAISAGLTMHIRIEGYNTHHKIESCFKAFAKCLYDASRIIGEGVVSTKGLL